MTNQLDFMQEKIELSEVQGAHRPISSGRQSELLAWLSAMGAFLGTAFLYWRSGELSGLAVGASLLFLFLAAVVSFGNWVERGTVLLVSEEGVAFRSPLRQAEFEWGQIMEMRLRRSNRAWRVAVEGDYRSFHFQSQGSLEFGGFDEMAVGMPAGAAIAALIRQQAHLNEVTQQGQDWVFRRDEG